MTAMKRAKQAIAGDSRPVERAGHAALAIGQSDSQKTQGNDTKQSGDGMQMVVLGEVSTTETAEAIDRWIAECADTGAIRVRTLTVRRGNGEKSPTRATATRQKLPTKCKGIS